MNQTQTESVEKIVQYFMKYAVLPEQPAHCEKSDDDLLDLIEQGVITVSHYKEVKKFKEAKAEDPAEVLRKMVVELISPKKKRGEGEMSRSDTQNKALIEHLGLPWRMVDSKVTISKLIKKLGSNGISFRNQFSSNEQFVSEFVKLAGGDNKAKKMVGEAMEAEVQKRKDAKK